LHPTAPLFDVTEQKLKPRAAEALKRIFRLVDVNNDGLLSDAELNTFQRKVFSAPLQQTEVEGVKDVVRQGFPDGVRQNSLTEDGFVYLHSLFVHRGRLETIWAVLRAFGYDDTVQLRHDFLYPEYDNHQSMTF
jgi:mitochondrial Rho GTPase 1